MEYTENLATGFSIHEKKDEELDLSSITLFNTTKDDEFSPFDKVLIYYNDTVIKGLLVAADSVNLVSKNPLLYNHELQLVEVTKKLERFFIDGKTFTQPIEEDSGYEPYTLLDVAMYLRASVPMRHTTEISNTGSQVKPYYEPLKQIIFNIPEETKLELDAVIAPEFTFKEVTLREALDDVASYIDCNVYLDENDNLRLNKFNQLNEQISNDDFVERILNRDIEYYSTNIETNVMNAVAKYDNGDVNVEHFPAKNIFSNSKVDGAVWDYPDSFLPTNNPIYDVKSVNLMLLTSVEYVINGEVEPDPPPFLPKKFVITNILERQKARELPVASGIIQASNPDQDYSNTSLIYDYGKKNVSLPVVSRVFSDLEAFNFVVYRHAIDNAKKIAFEISGQQAENIVFSHSAGLARVEYIIDSNTNTYVDVKFNTGTTSNFGENQFAGSVEYIPLKRSVRVNLEKDGISDTRYKSYTQANQQLRIVDIERYADKTKAKLNRLGLAEKILTQRVSSLNEVLNLGDFTTDKFIITERELIFYKDFIQCRYSFQKAFNRSSQFVGIDSQIRQWEIGENGRTVERNINYDEYVEVSSLDQYETGNNESLTINSVGTKKILNTLNKNYTDFDPLYLMTVEGKQNIIADDVTYTTPELILAFSKYTGGNQITFHTNLDDNVSVGERIERVVRWTKTNFLPERYEQRPTLFPDQFGRASNLKFRLYDYSENSTYQLNDIFDYNDNADIVPILDSAYDINENLCIEADLFVFKDNREKTALAITYHFLPKTDGLIIGNKLTKRNNLVSNIANQDLELRLYNDVWFTTRDKENVSLHNEIVKEELNVTINESDLTITINNDMEGYDAFAITNADGEPFILSNYNKKYLKFEFVRNRSGMFFADIPTELIELTSNAVTASVMDYVVALSEPIELTSNAVASSTLDYELGLNLTEELFGDSIGVGTLDYELALNQTIELQANSIGNGLINYDIIADIDIDLLSQATAKADMIIETDRPVEWVEGGSQTTPNKVCNNENDIGNVRVKSSTTTYEWVTINTYTAMTDESVSGTCNIADHVGNTRTVCFPDLNNPNQFACTVQECTAVTVTVYETCQLEV